MKHTQRRQSGERRMRRNRLVVHAVVLALCGCEARHIVLGRGDADAGTQSPVGTNAESQRESATGPTNSDAVPASSRDDGSSLSGTSAAVGSSGDDGSSNSDVCRDAYDRCMEEASGTMCQTLLINCRVALRDGGPPCSDVYPQCIALGYSVEDCERAAQVCEAGGEFEIDPPANSTL